MSQFIDVLTLTRIASGAVLAKTFVTAVGATSAAKGHALGVADHAAADGEALPVVVLGTAVVTAGGAIAEGAALQVGAGGKAVTQSDGVTVARALEAAAKDGDEIEVLLLPN